jgi:predicted nucleotidyltransferase
MRSLVSLNLKENEREALLELKSKLLQRFPNIEIILYGSKARGDFNKESDIDLLILIDSEISRRIRAEEFINKIKELTLKFIEESDIYS